MFKFRDREVDDHERFTVTKIVCVCERDWWGGGGERRRYYSQGRRREKKKRRRRNTVRGERKREGGDREGEREKDI